MGVFGWGSLLTPLYSWLIYYSKNAKNETRE